MHGAVPGLTLVEEKQHDDVAACRVRSVLHRSCLVTAEAKEVCSSKPGRQHSGQQLS